MKTRILSLLTAMLINVCAFAQSGNNEPLKGDLNEDGKVDVADIAAVIKIMKDGGGTSEETKYYFSVGTTEVTSSNYTTANNATTTIPTSIEYTSSQRVRHYFLVPSNKTLSVIDKNAQAPVPITEQIGHGIRNHKLYYTNGAIDSGATLVITLSQTIFYWYVGTTQPTAVNNPSAWRTSYFDAGFTETVELPAGTSWLAYPNTWTYSAVEGLSGDEFLFNAFVNNNIKTSIPGYILLKKVLGAEDTVTITFSKKNN